MILKTKTWQEFTTTYKEISPDDLLRSYIQCYWFNYADQSSLPARIIPDLCSDIIIQLSPDLDVLAINICGPNTCFFYSCVDQPTIYFGIRYHLSGMYPFLRQSLKGMKDQRFELGLVEKKLTADLVEKLSGKKSLYEIIESTNQYFLEQLNHLNTKKISRVVGKFLESYHHSLSYSECIANLTLSERSLQRLFREETGLSPYETFDVLRFQKVYQELIRHPEVKHLDLVEKYNFFDQAHYSRKIKKMAGVTPQEISQHVGILQDKS
ncbi:DUF6597 domain-containing transcriptional factor [Enterococcus quebecensis]|uniref:HTH araC/xylS-type domain-containing protein n=1 Tax=Enterococcus quebecensis TaxID=903983 RepID=A0A1E5GWN7_9ENTE|nr:helix-turn-helix domain-containing protein [Enterococcus quebecensis]OEG17131.1 hypothetical protein BCR23_03765 [Enterococcus quebecensis]OJG75517.1 hypothetical protein RV12_GL001320 [Enterococcus quebecensis]